MIGIISDRIPKSKILTKSMKILLVEDESSFCSFLRASLSSSQYTVDVVHDGKSAREMLDFFYDLVILDVNLPDISGIQLCRQLRSQGITIPILMLTASAEDLIAGLDVGADDYLVKPCRIEELLARMRALLRRGKSVESPILTWENLSLNPSSKKVFFAHQEINLRPKEYQLLELFLRNPQRVFSRDDIIDRLWTMAEVPTSHAVTNLIKDLRRRLQQSGMVEECIETVYGMGYRLKSPSSNVVTGKASSEPKESLAEIQDRFMVSLNQKMEILRQAITLLNKKQLSPDQQQESQRIAHQLAGTLGTFGYPTASPIARSIELQFKQVTDFADNNIQELFQKLEKEIAQPPAKIGFFAPLSVAHTLLLVTNNMPFADAFYLQAMESKFVVEVTEEETVFAKLTDNLPTAIVLLLSTPNSLKLLKEIHQTFSTLPTIVVDEHSDSLDRRIEIARYQPYRYFVNPTSPVLILQAATELIVTATKAKIMVMDDDPIFLDFITQILEAQSFLVIRLSHSAEFWQILKDTMPDLLLLDWEMPGYNGIELCRVIRQDAQFANLPIVFVTNHAELSQELFSAGADDVIIKPITVDKEFVFRIQARLGKPNL